MRERGTPSIRRSVALGLLIFLVCALASSHARSAGDEFEVILRRGTVLDGTGLPRFKADIGILNERVAKIGNLSGDRALIDLDVTGLFVAPGFINIHSHASPDALPRAENMLTQGVTTEIVNPDGDDPTDLGQQLYRLSASGIAVNVGAYIGFNSVWSSVMGAADRRATTDDIGKMRQLITDGLENGAWGVSAGLDDKPAYFARVEEVIEVVDVASKWRTNFSNHDRITPESSYSSRAGVSETIAIAEKAGLVPVVTHMKAPGLEQGTAAALLAMMQQAGERGHYTAADASPYLAGQSGLGGTEPDLVKILQHPSTSIACDCGATTETRTHPRTYGTFPRVLGRYVRENKQLTWEDAVRKMTGLPASTIGLVDRGLLAPGMVADVTVFDPNTVIDHATYEDPARLSEGIRHVLVNGQLALHDGQVTRGRAGRVLMRSPHMPSRPMSTSTTRRIVARGPMTEIQREDATPGQEILTADIAIDVTQTANAIRAKGSFRFTDRSSKFTFESTDLGILQATDTWASFTARIKRRPGNDEGSILVIVETADPFAPNQSPTVTVEIEGAYRFSGVVTRRDAVRVSSGRASARAGQPRPVDDRKR